MQKYIRCQSEDSLFKQLCRPLASQIPVVLDLIEPRVVEMVQSHNSLLS